MSGCWDVEDHYEIVDNHDWQCADQEDRSGHGDQDEDHEGVQSGLGAHSHSVLQFVDDVEVLETGIWVLRALGFRLTLDSRLMILPIGVVSKKEMGALRRAWMSGACRRYEARRLPIVRTVKARPSRNTGKAYGRQVFVVKPHGSIW